MQGFNIAKAARCLEDAMQSEGFTFKYCLSGDSDDEIATRLVWVVLNAAFSKREPTHVNSKYSHVNVNPVTPEEERVLREALVDRVFEVYKEPSNKLKELHFTPEQKKEIGRVLLRKDTEKPTEEMPEKHDWLLYFI